MQKGAAYIESWLMMYGQKINIGNPYNDGRRTNIDEKMYDSLARHAFVHFVNNMKLEVEGRMTKNKPGPMKVITGIQLLNRIDSWYNKANRYHTDMSAIQEKIAVWMDQIADLTDGFQKNKGPDATPTAAKAQKRDEVSGEFDLTAAEEAEIEKSYKDEQESVNRIIRYSVPHNRPFKLREAMAKKTPWAEKMTGFQYPEKSNVITFINASVPTGSDCEQVSHVVDKYAEMTNEISDKIESYTADKEQFEGYKTKFTEGLKQLDKDLALEVTNHKYTNAETRDLRSNYNTASTGIAQWIADMTKQLSSSNKRTLGNFRTTQIAGTLRSTIDRYHSGGDSESDLKKYISYLAHMGTASIKRTSVQSDMASYGNLDHVAKHLVNLTSPTASVEESEPHLSQLKSTIYSLQQKSKSCRR